MEMIVTERMKLVGFSSLYTPAETLVKTRYGERNPGFLPLTKSETRN